MTLRELLGHLIDHRISIRHHRGQVLLSPAGAVTPDLAAAVTANKTELLELLKQRRDNAAWEPWEVALTPADWEEWIWQQQRSEPPVSTKGQAA